MLSRPIGNESALPRKAGRESQQPKSSIKLHVIQEPRNPIQKLPQRIIEGDT
jgi:hypothetical protein